MEFKRIGFIVSIVSILCASCANISKAPIATTTPQPTVTLFPTITPFSTSTPTALPTLTFTATPTIIPTSVLGRGWFAISELTPAESVNLETAKSFIGIRIPPLPDNIIEEFVYLYPDGGELPSWTLYHQIFIMRKGNARMIWLGIPFAETISFSESRIYDVIPMPPTHPDEVLIAFTCSRNNEVDDSLVVIASRPIGDEPATVIHYAWQIDSTSTTLQPVNYPDIECWSY